VLRTAHAAPVVRAHARIGAGESVV